MRYVTRSVYKRDTTSENMFEWISTQLDRLRTKLSVFGKYEAAG